MDFTEILYKIFIKDGGWLTILNGLWVTVQISALSLFLGTLLGSLLCFFRVGKFTPLKVFAQVYISIIRGSPVLMLLMLLFYGVFARTGMAPLVVAVITFSMHTAAHVAELLRASLMALDKGQVEAARTLGFSKATCQNRKAVLSIDRRQSDSVDKRRRLRHDNRFDARDKQHRLAHNATNDHDNRRHDNLSRAVVSDLRNFSLDGAAACSMNRGENVGENF